MLDLYERQDVHSRLESLVIQRFTICSPVVFRMNLLRQTFLGRGRHPDLDMVDKRHTGGTTG